MYQAIVAPIQTRPHPNADRLQLGSVAGFQVIVSKDVKDGELGVFFPSDGQLSHDFCFENNEYRKGEGLNKNPEKAGYFDANRRVKTIKLRGAVSEGFWVPFPALAFTGVTSLPAGTAFTELGGYQICQKYFTPATTRAMKQEQKQGKTKKKILMFKEHEDTQQLRYYIDSIPEGATIIITAKLHGTSGRTGNVLVEQPLAPKQNLWNRWFGWLHTFQPQLLWEKVTGTRRVVLENAVETENNWYAGENFRQRIHQGLNPSKGETLYYEIVGYTSGGASIMPPHNILPADKDEVRSELHKIYGQHWEDGNMYYTYGCQPGQFKIFIYRITHTDVDGNQHEMSWDQIQARSNLLGVAKVPELHRIHNFSATTEAKQALYELCARLTAGPDPIDPRHVAEGVCLRIEHPGMYGKILKYKGFNFCHLENIKKNDDFYIDPEEIA